MDEQCPTCHSEDGVSQGACSVGGKVHPHPDAPCSPTSPGKRQLFPGSDIAAAALGTTFIFGGLAVGMLGLAPIPSWLGNSEMAGIAWGMSVLSIVVPLWATLTLSLTPVFCFLRTRTVTRGVIATALAFTSLGAGVWAVGYIADPEQSIVFYALMILPYPGILATPLIGMLGAMGLTAVQIALGVILLLFNQCVSLLMGSKLVWGNRNERFVSREPR